MQAAPLHIGCPKRAASHPSLILVSLDRSPLWQLLPGATSHARAGPGFFKEHDDRPGNPDRPFFLPPVSVAMKKGLSSKVLIALLLQLCGHIPGVIYGIYVVTRE